MEGFVLCVFLTTMDYYVLFVDIELWTIRCVRFANKALLDVDAIFTYYANFDADI